MRLMGVFVRVRVRMHRSIGVRMLVGVALRCAMVMGVRVGVCVFVVGVISCGMYMVVQTFIMVINNDVDLGAGKAAAADLMHFKVRADIERGGGLFEKGKGNTRIDEGAKQHVTADAGEAF